MKQEIHIYYNDQKSESGKIKKVLDLAEIDFDIRMSQASIGMNACGFETPVVDINHNLYAYQDAIAMLLEIATKKESA